MSTARLTIAYDGTAFAGWAAQTDQRTVQAELEAALERILGEPLALTVAGRTDAGVHASGQVASFEHPGELPDQLAQRLNAVLPLDLAVLAAAPAPDGFDARRSARARVYRYRVLASPIRDPFERRRALWHRHRLDREALRRCAELVVGRHDFTAFTPTQTKHVLFEREVEGCEWSEERPGLLAMTIASEAFMRNQVRVLVGTMLEVGGGRRSLEDFGALLEGASRERAGDTAAAHGLTLIAVRY